MDWVGQYRQFWEERLDRLDAYLQLLQTQSNPKSPKTKGEKP
jgi:hypothetical protein